VSSKTRGEASYESIGAAQTLGAGGFGQDTEAPVVEPAFFDGVLAENLHPGVTPVADDHLHPLEDARLRPFEDAVERITLVEQQTGQAGGLVAGAGDGGNGVEFGRRQAGGGRADEDQPDQVAFVVFSVAGDGVDPVPGYRPSGVVTRIPTVSLPRPLGRE
jgi:hypothetical protein